MSSCCSYNEQGCTRTERSRPYISSFYSENHVPWENVHPVLLAELGVGESDPGESAKPKEENNTQRKLQQ